MKHEEALVATVRLFRMVPRQAALATHAGPEIQGLEEDLSSLDLQL